MVFVTTREEDARESGIYEENKTYGPIVICAGKQQVLPGLDEAIIGKEIGFEGEIEIAPDKAYGEREQNLMRSFKKKEFKEKPIQGMQVSMPDVGNGTVMKIIGNSVLVDFNHPLAGQTLTYSFRIEESVQDPVDQVQGLIRIFSGVDAQVTVIDRIAEVNLPAGIHSYSRLFVSGKPYITYSIFDLVEGVDEIRYIEKFTKPEKKTEEGSDQSAP